MLKEWTRPVQTSETTATRSLREGRQRQTDEEMETQTLFDKETDLTVLVPVYRARRETLSVQLYAIGAFDNWWVTAGSPGRTESIDVDYPQAHCLSTRWSLCTQSRVNIKV